MHSTSIPAHAQCQVVNILGHANMQQRAGAHVGMSIFCARSRRLDGFPRTCVMRMLSMLAMSARCAISCGGPCWLNSTTSLPRGSAAGP